MNYLAHAWRAIHFGSGDPYELAGVAVPDWLGVAARRTKCRSRDAAPHADAEDPRLAALARGVLRHHADDAWFHDSPAFGVLSLAFAKRVREALGESSSLRPWFLGHVLVELLLDAELAAREPRLLDDYYERIARVDPEWVAGRVGRMSRRDVGRLAHFIGRYAEVQFLRDYADDERLAHRLNQVMQRVSLEELPPAFLAVLPACRRDVAASFEGLLLGEEAGRLETFSRRRA